jgi:hypothetical protein
MGHEPPVRTAGRTGVVATWLIVLAVAGRPVWAAALLSAVLVLVWAAPNLLGTNRRRARPRPRAGRVPHPS